jgi:hypothetical protein
MDNRMDDRTSIAALLMSNLLEDLSEHAAKVHVPMNHPELAAAAADVAVTLTDALLDRLKQ